jgi:hypothetical protein
VVPVAAGLFEPGAVPVVAGFGEEVEPPPVVLAEPLDPLVGVALVPAGVELAGNSVMVLGASGTGFESALATNVFSCSGVASALLRSL